MQKMIDNAENFFCADKPLDINMIMGANNFMRDLNSLNNNSNDEDTFDQIVKNAINDNIKSDNSNDCVDIKLTKENNLEIFEDFFIKI